jgi:hypothetical protein
MLSSFTGEKVSQSGPYGTISITLPKEWSYTLCEVDDTKLKVGDYGIHFYPSEEKWGYVEVAYASLFGVCGTGLETKEVTLAGDKAEMGFYDGSDIWEFVAFEGKNEKIVASTSGVSSWWAKYSEEVLEILNTLSYNK